MKFSRRSRHTEPANPKSEKALLSKKALLDLFVGHRVDSPFPGDWESMFKGSGFEFWGLRPIEPGDPFQRIDWKATAKTGEYTVREFLAESYYNLMILYDVSRSVAFGRKELLQANIAVSLAYSAIAANNGCGLITFADRVYDYLPPRMGLAHFMQILTTIVNSEPLPCTQTRIDPCLTKLINEVPESLTFIVSDFLFPWDGTFHFQRGPHGTNKHEVRALQVLEKTEVELPPDSEGMVLLADSETGREFLLDVGRWREFNRDRRRQLAEIRQDLRRAGIELLLLTPGDHVRKSINAFVKETGTLRPAVR